MSTTPRLDLEEHAEGGINGKLTANTATRFLEAVTAGYLTEIGQNAPPSSPIDGVLVVVGTTPTGVFVSHDNELALGTIDSVTGVELWLFLAPKIGYGPLYLDSGASHAEAGNHVWHNGTTWVTFTGAGGTTVFTGLTDTPSSYVGNALDVVRVNSGETALEFSAPGTPAAHAASHVDGSDDIQSATASQKGVATAAQITKLDGIEVAATADQTDVEIANAYGNEVDVVSQAEAEAGTATTVRRWTAERVKQAIAALETGGGGSSLPVVDTTSLVEGSVDATKEMRIEVDGLTTSTVRVLTMADQNISLVPNTGSFPAAAHASRHTGGSDDIQSATSLQKGVMTAVYASKLDAIEASATADQSNAEIETAYNAQVSLVSQAEAEAGTSTTVRRWTALRVAQAIAALESSPGAPASHGASHTDGSDDIQNATASQKGVATATQITKLDGIETAATADQSNAEIETAYNAQVSIVSQAEAEAGTATTVRRWTALRVAQAIAALETGGGIGNLVEDLSPQLGGNLDTLGNNIFNSSGVIVSIEDDLSVNGDITLSGVITDINDAIVSIGESLNVAGSITLTGNVDGHNIGADFRKVLFLGAPDVLEYSLDTPPGSPTEGQAYHIGTGSGVWVGRDNEVARWSVDDATWEFYSDHGMRIAIRSTASHAYGGHTFQYDAIEDEWFIVGEVNINAEYWTGTWTANGVDKVYGKDFYQVLAASPANSDPVTHGVSPDLAKPCGAWGIANGANGIGVFIPQNFSLLVQCTVGSTGITVTYPNQTRGKPINLHMRYVK